MNPVLKNMRNMAPMPQQPQNQAPYASPTAKLISDLQNGMNAEMAAQDILQNNPNTKPFIAGLRGMGNNPRDIAMTLAQKNGIPNDELMAIARLVGAS